MKMPNLSIARTLLCVAIIALSAQGHNARSARASSVSFGSSSAILCKPGLVYRCTPLGCFCVKP